MRVLLDECLPRRLRTHLPGHDVRTVPEMGWSGLKDAALMSALTAAGFKVLLTADRNLRHQLNLRTAAFAVVVLVAASNRRADLEPLMPSVLAVLGGVAPGTVIEVPD